jgi:hypothetical protein
MTDQTGLRPVPLDAAAWGLTGLDHRRTAYLGRPCIQFGDANLSLALPGVVLEDGVVEVDLAVTRERSFHGPIWRVRDGENFESFFVRPHQVGNPDSIQYTPVNNDIPSWQLYHGPGFWAPVAFPIEAWFTIRVAFAGSRADVYVGDLGAPVLRIGELKRPPAPGGVGLQVGGPGLRVARFAYSAERPTLSGSLPPPDAARPGVIRDWNVSDPFLEIELAGMIRLPLDLVGSRVWTPLVAEPSGLLDVSRADGLHDGRNTVLTRTTVRAPRDLVVPLEIGFSDRAVVFLNGQALFRGDDSYRSRDYRFLGSIGYWDAVYLPLTAGDNELVVAVSEDLGGWGVQARFADGGAWQSRGADGRAP